jgi:hypothetical protein
MAFRSRFVGVLVVALAACGSGGASDGGDAGGSCNPTPSRTPQQCDGLACEGTQCTLVADGGPSNCPSGLDCVDWCSYNEGFGICRLPCGSGCPTGESCLQNQGGSSTMSCQCTPAEAPCGVGDSCAPYGLECNPIFQVCQAPLSSSSCPPGLEYSSLWKLCLSSC